MTTNREKRLEREEAILQTLKRLDLCYRSQLQEIHNLGSNRNASRVLKQMDQWLNCFQEKEAVYYLNKAGRERVGSTKVISKTSIYAHTLMRNDIYCHYRPKVWQNEYEIKVQDVHIISDAVFRIKEKFYLLEVDNQQKMAANKEKLEAYLKFKNTGIWQKNNQGLFPTILFYTQSDYRKAQLKEYNPGLPLSIITKKDLA